MAINLRLIVLALLFCAGFSSVSFAQENARAGSRSIPEPLREWQGWALWDSVGDLASPPVYNDATVRHGAWPSLLKIEVQGNRATFTQAVRVYTKVRLSLPVAEDAWPREVRANGEAIPVVPGQEGLPTIELAPGEHQISGELLWPNTPRTVKLPKEVGIVELTLDGRRVEFPAWDASGTLWLRQEVARETEERDFIETKVYALLVDGIPMRWRAWVEVTISGKNREERIGRILPEGWRLSELRAEIPAMLDDEGQLVAQVRSGRWKILLEGFQLDAPESIHYPEGKPAAVTDSLVAFQANPTLRTVDLEGVQQVDATQTTFPDEWKQFPIYRWATAQPIVLKERMRGSGEERSGGLAIQRTLWLDEQHGGFTFSDFVTGQGQTLWRLDVSGGQILESARAGGVGQLITRNPETGAAGVEIRNRAFNLNATGHITNRSVLPASGWQVNAESLGVLLHLPPGWRLFACFGADKVDGDWLTAWTLLDLFLLLVFTVAVFRLWGIWAALVAFFAFAISYHEPGAPVYEWLVLLIPLALLRVVRDGSGRKVIEAFKWALLLVLLIVLVPFLIQQVQQTIYPQLEPRANQWLGASAYSGMASPTSSSLQAESAEGMAEDAATPMKRNKAKSSYVKVEKERVYEQESTARVQTGRGVPEWKWRAVSLEWDGPVAATQEIKPILLPRGVVRGLTLLRVALLIALVAILLEVRKAGAAWVKSGKLALSIAAAMLLLPASASAQESGYPSSEMLDTLRQRLLKEMEQGAFPNAADIPFVRLSVADRQLTMEAQVHVDETCAVPLPGRLPAWAPVRVTVNGEGGATVARLDGFLWVVLPEGVHSVRVEGIASPQAEWEWSWKLAPREVEVIAPDWNVTGWSEHPGRPGAELFFSRKEPQSGGAAASGYDRQEVESWVSVERTLELGLTWQVTTRVVRQTPVGRSLNLRIPLLAGERVVSRDAAFSPEGNAIEVRLGAQDAEYSWTSNLERADKIQLSAAAQVPWVEQWRVEVSPVWNIAIQGIQPIFAATPHLVPIWNPWPGEGVELTISRPEAIEGPTVAIQNIQQRTQLGARQRTASLVLNLQSSMGEEFGVTLPQDAEITKLQLKGADLPVRRDNGKVMVTLASGEQLLELGWRRDEALGFVSRTDEIKLPYESMNLTANIVVPENRWTLWAAGPLQGPAIRFWGILVTVLLGGLLLGRLPNSPLKPYEWALLLVGLTQGAIILALVVVAWFFLLVWRGSEGFRKLSSVGHDLVQLVLMGLTLIFVSVLIYVVGKGLLGSPTMFISGNGSGLNLLNWYQPQSGEQLPQMAAFTVSIWWYRLLMLLWALWLANGLVRWLGWAWKQFSKGSVFKPIFL